MEVLMARVTYEDVARHAGVSTATVSRVLSGRGGVREDAAARVRASASALGYRSHRAAKALRRQQADAIGLVISDVENPFFASVARAVEDLAAKHGHAVLLCNTDEDLEKEALYLDLMIGESVAGVIVAPSTEELGPLGVLMEAGIPTVTVDRRVSGDPFDSVLVDHRAGARALVEHLLEHGHEHVGAVTGTTAATPSRERLAGCREAVEAHGGAELSVAEGQLQEAIGATQTLQLGERLARDLLESADGRPTAVFGANGLLTQGVLRAVRSSRLRVPRDVAIVGFDDLPVFDLLEPPLTVAAQPTEQLGRTAAELLFQRIATPDRDVETIVIEPEIRIRRSCGRHR
jgi:DNA-binding LacI/PurR family transcriptional regulator